MIDPITRLRVTLGHRKIVIEALDEIERVRAALETIRQIAGRRGPPNMIEALNQIEVAARNALTHEQAAPEKGARMLTGAFSDHLDSKDKPFVDQ